MQQPLSAFQGRSAALVTAGNHLALVLHGCMRYPSLLSMEQASASSRMRCGMLLERSSCWLLAIRSCCTWQARLLPAWWSHPAPPLSSCQLRAAACPTHCRALMQPRAHQVCIMHGQAKSKLLMHVFCRPNSARMAARLCRPVMHTPVQQLHSGAQHRRAAASPGAAA